MGAGVMVIEHNPYAPPAAEVADAPNSFPKRSHQIPFGGVEISPKSADLLALLLYVDTHRPLALVISLVAALGLIPALLPVRTAYQLLAP
jgi:hypothetical protein